MTVALSVGSRVQVTSVSNHSRGESHSCHEDIPFMGVIASTRMPGDAPLNVV